jgi:hypothetical protein
MKLNNTLPPMGSLAHNKAPQAKPNLNTQRDGSVELVITTMNTLNLSGFLNGVTQDLIPHLSARIVKTEDVIQNRVLADAGRPGSRSFLEITREELLEISEFLGFYLQGDSLLGRAKPVIQAAHLEFRNPYDPKKLRGIREDLRRLKLPQNNLPIPNPYRLNFKPADADGGGQLLEIPFILTTNLASTSKTIRGLAEIIGQMGEQLFDQKATHGV